MIDKIQIKAIIDPLRDAPAIIKRWKLDECTRNGEVFYQSGDFGNFEGVQIMLRGSVLQVKCSVHKLYEKWTNNRLDNSTPFTMLQARDTLEELVNRLEGVDVTTARVNYYEIGKSMQMQREAVSYIEKAVAIRGKELFNDANFEKNRQKTTEKSKTIKKIFKIYDKSHEARTKRRKAALSNVLRIETIYRHQSARLADFFDVEWLEKMRRKFYEDWSLLEWMYEVEAEKGVKMSEYQKACEIMAVGVEGYRAKYKELFAAGKITKKQKETMRSFVNRWPEVCRKFNVIHVKEEFEYMDNLVNISGLINARFEGQNNRLKMNKLNDENVKKNDIQDTLRDTCTRAEEEKRETCPIQPEGVSGTTPNKGCAEIYQIRLMTRDKQKREKMMKKFRMYGLTVNGICYAEVRDREKMWGLWDLEKQQEIKIMNITKK